MANLHTYFVKSKYFPETYIDKQFAKRGNWKKANIDVKKHKQMIDFIYLDELYYTDKTYYMIQSLLKNTVNDDKREITLKHNLIRNLLHDKIGKQYVMPQYELDLFKIKMQNKLNIATNKTNGDTNSEIYTNNYMNILSKYKTIFDNENIYIFKPITSFGGSDINIFNNYDNFVKYCIKIMEDININKYWGKNNPSKEKLRIWVLQKYITNPLLIEKQENNTINKYKFHIRQVYLYQPGNKPSYYRPLNLCPIAIANQPYINNDWDNKNIHDTHFHKKIDYKWSDIIEMIPSLAKKKSAIQQINRQLDDIYRIIDNTYINAQCYPETKHCFEIFGCDIMITDTFDVKLIEINNGLGISGTINDKHDIFDNILGKIVDVYYPPINRFDYDTNNSFIKIYNSKTYKKHNKLPNINKKYKTYKK
jgi:hypothetical protein